ncbi:hypothetical protein J8J14_15580 [Roseomonas sp. SSH11]|uniref:Methyltransferase type 11 domain-containing protein n=1 Tax=Pararoseomonas baculiformis TaxID=2820812 RepID=A0ABS4AH49_9PROT|nr:hypothetical protein [Pararoseomonas baculiformis]MBP0446194.1 hypothetical protein [Pararoseomonas baculiformis]
MPHLNPGENPANDPAWAGAARFLEGRVPQGQRVVAPGSFTPVLGEVAAPEPDPLPDWAVVPTGGAAAFPGALVRRLLAETTAVYANDGYVVFARRPTFGLADMRNAPPVRALADRTRAEAEPKPAAAPGPTLIEASLPKAGQPPEASITPLTPPKAPGIPRATLPPEALALRVPAPPARPEPSPAAAPPAAAPLPAALPPSLAPAPPPPAPAAGPPAPVARRDTGWGTLPSRIAALLGPGPGRRLAALGTGSMELAAAAMGPAALLADAAEPQPENCFDAVLLLPDATSLAPDLASASRLLRSGGVALVVAENAESLGRRLAAALGRPADSAGLSAAAIRGALHAASLSPLRLEGHSLDAWRASGDQPPAGLAPSAPAAALMEEAGEAAGPRHAAWLLFLARKG